MQIDTGNSVAVDPAGTIYVAGEYYRNNGPEINADGTVICYSPGGTRQWMTSTDIPSHDILTDLSLSPDRVWATGSTLHPTYWSEFLVVEIEKQAPLHAERSRQETSGLPEPTLVWAGPATRQRDQTRGAAGAIHDFP